MTGLILFKLVAILLLLSLTVLATKENTRP